MAETDKDERTEDATARRLDRERSRGNLPYSKEASAAALLLVFVLALRFSGEALTEPIKAAFEGALSLRGGAAPKGDVLDIAFHLVAPALLPAGAALLLAAVVVAATGFGQAGISFSSERLEFKPEKLNPISGIKRVFSFRSVGTVAFGAAKIAVVGWLAYGAIAEVAAAFSAVPIASLGAAADAALDGCLKLALRVGLFLAAFASADVAWRRFSYKKDLRMTKQEVKDEHKQEEGDAHVKGEIKRRMREIAKQKMIRDVRKATVVVRNPTHFAVALRYDRRYEEAPRVLAKGADGLALRIIAEAEKRGVPVVSRPEVAREIYRTVKLGKTVPPALYKAAAALLAYVAKKRRRAS
jgi:flagellar biosynthesis protein FlhB